MKYIDCCFKYERNKIVMPKDCLPELQIGDIAELAPTTNVNSESHLFLLGLAKHQNAMTGGPGRGTDSLPSIHMFIDNDRLCNVNEGENSSNNAVTGDLQSAALGQTFPNGPFNEADGPGASPDMPGFEGTDQQSIQPTVNMGGNAPDLISANDVVTVTFQNNSIMADQSGNAQHVQESLSQTNGQLTFGHVERETFLANDSNQSLQNAFQLSSGQIHGEQPSVNPYQSNLAQGHMDLPQSSLSNCYPDQLGPSMSGQLSPQSVNHMPQNPVQSTPFESGQNQASMFPSVSNQNTHFQTNSNSLSQTELVTTPFQAVENTENIHSHCPSSGYKFEQIQSPPTTVSGETIHSQPITYPSSIESGSCLQTNPSATASYQSLHIQNNSERSQLNSYPDTSQYQAVGIPNDLGSFHLNQSVPLESDNSAQTSALQGMPASHSTPDPNNLGSFHLNQSIPFESDNSAQTLTLQGMPASQSAPDHVTTHQTDQLKEYDNLSFTMNQPQSNSLQVNHYPPNTVEDTGGQQAGFLTSFANTFTTQPEQFSPNTLNTNTSPAEVNFHNSNSNSIINSTCSNDASGHCSPHLSSPLNTSCTSGFNEGPGPLQLDFSDSALIRQLVTHISNMSSPESSPSETPLRSPTRETPTEHMEHCTNSQSSLIEMSEKLIIDTPSQNGPHGLLSKAGIDYEAFFSNFNEDAVFDPPTMAQRSLEDSHTPSSAGEFVNTSDAVSGVSSSAFSIVSQPGIFTFDTQNFATSTTQSTGITPSGTENSTNEAENAVFPIPTKPAPQSRKQANGRSKKFREPTLTQQFPASFDGCQLKIIDQPEDQHRARYMTEGSRGAVKDRSLQGHPSIKLFGVQETVTLQVFVGGDGGRVKPHGFYQACKVCGKNSTPCTERDIEGTTVIELQLNPADDMTARIDCVGILKLRNADVENRIGLVKAKKKSVKARMVFRVTYKKSDGCYQTLQVASQPILCTQPIGCPEISKKSLTQSSVRGGEELFMIGKNFMKGTKVCFTEISESGNTTWEKEVEFDKDYFQNTHLICTVPEYHNLKIQTPVTVQITVRCGTKASDPQMFTYNPVVEPRHEQMETETSVVQKPLPSNVSPVAMELNRRFENESSSSRLKFCEGTVPSTYSSPSENNGFKVETSQDCLRSSNMFNIVSAPAVAPSVDELLRSLMNKSKPV